MEKLARALFGFVIGYIGGALLGWSGLELFSSNAHDKSVEAAMTAAFVTGPIGAVLGVAAILLRRR